METSKRAQLGGLTGMIVAIGSAIIVSALTVYTLVVMNSSGLNASNDAQAVLNSGISATQTTVNFIPLIVIAVIGGLIISIYAVRR